MRLLYLMLLITGGLLIAGSQLVNSTHKFSHKFHAEEVGAECEDCHAAAVESVTGADNLYPGHENCFTCHDEENTECGMCHADGDDPVALSRIENYSANFSHKLHTEKGVSCLDCHTGIDKKDDAASQMHLPGMSRCMECHTTPAEKEGCFLCHQSDENLKPMDHNLGWTESHGMYSETKDQNCNSCHRQNFCIDCHQGQNLLNESHPANFISTHSISYLSREVNCGSCHQNRDFCIDCHVNVNQVIPASHAVPEWSGSAHGIEARIDYERCSVCHYQGDPACTACHK